MCVSPERTRDLAVGTRRPEQRPELAPHDDATGPSASHTVLGRSIAIHPGLLYSRDG
jgi:hypothetical protein